MADPTQEQFTFCGVTIDSPPLPPTTTPVRAATGATSGDICAYGDVSGNPAGVWGKVYLPGAFLHDDPPLSDPQVVQGTIVGTRFCIERGGPHGRDIPGARCGSPPGVDNVLRVWVRCQGTGMVHRHDTRSFKGVTAADTECGSAGAACAQRALRGAQQQAGLDIAPYQWRVEAAGFGGPARALNGPWVLTLRQGPDLNSAWDNDGDGVAGPRLELHFHAGPEAEWRLLLRHGPVVAVYAAPAADWRWLGANDLRAKSPGEFPGPVCLRLVPV